MVTLPPHITESLERLNRVYFCDPARTVEIPEGHRLVSQGEVCPCVYLILQGSVVAYRHAEQVQGTELPEDTAGRGYEVFRAGSGSYVCVQSYFSGARRCSTDIVALEPTRLAYVDDTTPLAEEEIYGNRAQQFLPVLIHELAMRNTRIFDRTTEKEEVIRLLHRAEMSSTLAQLTAGIAHELNNAVGVITRRVEFVAEQLRSCLGELGGVNAELFSLGYADDAVISPAELRSVARRYERRRNLSQPAAQVLAHIAPTEEALARCDKELVRRVGSSYRFWELGHDMHDMQLAARHAAGIVRAVKMMGAADNCVRKPGVDVVATVRDAITLLCNRLQQINVRTDFQPLPPITADETELVQVWTNIIKNACDAMSLAATPNPTLIISTACYHASGLNLLPRDYLRIAVSNNGPAIPEEIREKIFSPSFTTKKRGLDFGLGVGLAIVRRVVDSYNGTIGLESNDSLTTFTINLPITNLQNIPDHGKN